jgi:hypothetical protein
VSFVYRTYGIDLRKKKAINWRQTFADS